MTLVCRTIDAPATCGHEYASPLPTQMNIIELISLHLF